MREPQIQIGNSDLRPQIKLLMWPGSVYSPCSDCSSRRTKEALPSKGAARIALRLFLLSLMCVTLLYPTRAGAQDNYEIQVYPSETMAPKTLLIELHSNFTVEGSTTTQFGMLPTEHQEHETIELTEGINDWSEVGFYIFTAEQSGHGVQWVGDHIRPRVRIPPRWHWPVGVSLSSEFGYARPAYSNPTWSWQFMPIVDQTIGRWYWSVNGTMVWNVHVVPAPADLTVQQKQAYYRDVAPRDVTFGPAATLTYAPSRHFNFGVEYYSYYGRLGNFVTLHYQQHQVFPVVNLFVSPKWEINFGAGWGATAGTDHLIVKCIIGRYFDWSHHRPGSSDSTQ